MKGKKKNLLKIKYLSFSTDHMLPSSTGHFFYGHPAYGHGGGGGGGGHYLHHTETYPAIHEEHYYAPIYQDHEEEYHKQNYKGKGSDLSIKDFFEIALTALAFLSFGVFIIHLLMNATVHTGYIRYFQFLFSTFSSYLSLLSNSRRRT